MTKVRCQDCGEIMDVKVSDIDDTSCDCGGDLARLGSEDDTYEPTCCPICKKEIKPDDDSYSCDECNEEDLCEDCTQEFENAGVTLCNNCLKDIVKTETKIEYQDRIVEKEVLKYVDKDGTPIDTSYNPNKKSRFD
jgi:predicted nucleic acid-binding Zn ribbon protein